MFNTSAFVIALLASSIMAAPTDNSSKTKRDVDKGNSSFNLDCTAQTIPDPVAKSGTSYFKNILWYQPPNGADKIHPSDCRQDPDDGTCQICTIEGGGLSSPTDVHACWLPPSGKLSCNLRFQYGAISYNSYKHDNNDQYVCEKNVSNAPFTSDINTACYFNTP